MQSKIEKIILEVIQTINDDKKLPALEKPDATTELYDMENRALNFTSLDLLTILSEVHDSVSETYGVEVNLLDV